MSTSGPKQVWNGHCASAIVLGSGHCASTIVRCASGEALKASFSKTAPAEIEYIVTVSDIEEVGCHWQCLAR